MVLPNTGKMTEINFAKTGSTILSKTIVSNYPINMFYSQTLFGAFTSQYLTTNSDAENRSGIITLRIQYQKTDYSWLTWGLVYFQFLYQSTTTFKVRYFVFIKDTYKVSNVDKIYTFNDWQFFTLNFTQQGQNSIMWLKIYDDPYLSWKGASYDAGNQTHPNYDAMVDWRFSITNDEYHNFMDTGDVAKYSLGALGAVFDGEGDPVLNYYSLNSSHWLPFLQVYNQRPLDVFDIGQLDYRSELDQLDSVIALQDIEINTLTTNLSIANANLLLAKADALIAATQATNAAADALLIKNSVNHGTYGLNPLQLLIAAPTGNVVDSLFTDAVSGLTKLKDYLLTVLAGVGDTLGHLINPGYGLSKLDDDVIINKDILDDLKAYSGYAGSSNTAKEDFISVDVKIDTLDTKINAIDLILDGIVITLSTMWDVYGPKVDDLVTKVTLLWDLFINLDLTKLGDLLLIVAELTLQLFEARVGGAADLWQKRIIEAIIAFTSCLKVNAY